MADKNVFDDKMLRVTCWN